MFQIAKKLKKNYNKAADTCPSAIQFVPECFKIQKMCDNAVDICPFVFHSVLDRYKTQKMCYKAFSEDPFMTKYHLNRYKSQEMCDKVVDDFLPTLKIVPAWFLINKMVKKLYDALFADATFSSNEMGILSVDLNNVNLDGANFYEDDPKTSICQTFGLT